MILIGRGGDRHPDGQRSLATEFPRRRLTLITTAVIAVGCTRFALAATAGDEAPERRRIHVMCDGEATRCLDTGMEMPGDGRVVRPLETLLKRRAIETTTRVATIASDAILGVCRRRLSATRSSTDVSDASCHLRSKLRARLRRRLLTLACPGPSVCD
jgi:hypothetical protein